MLTRIKEEELIFSGNIEDDRTNTYLTLNDYDWMDYRLETRFKTEAQGVLEISFQYFGMTSCHMVVNQKLNNKEKEYRYEFSTDIFKAHLIKYMRDHIAGWDSKYAFNGEEQVIEFFNEVISIGTIIEEKDIEKTL